MVINFRCLLIVMLLFHLILPVFSFKPSGGVLVLERGVEPFDYVGSNQVEIALNLTHGVLNRPVPSI